MVFSNGAMLSMLDKSDSVNEHNQEISELMKLHIQWCGKIPMKFIRHLTHTGPTDTFTIAGVLQVLQ